MFRDDFYNASIRKYVTVFGGLFSAIEITRQDNNNNTIQAMKVPISYGPREKFLARIEEDPNLDRGYSVLLPRMGFEIIKMVYAADRKLSSTVSYAGTSTAKNGYNKVYVPVPYDLTIRLSVMVKEAEDGAKIVEQILPYFTPEFTTTLHMLDEIPSYKIDVPIVLNSILLEDTYSTDFKTRRTLIYTLDFIMKAYFFGPVTKAPVIKITKTSLIANNDFFVQPDYTSTLRPGLLANNYPTTNSSLSLPINQIYESNNYGLINSQAEFPNNG